MPSLGIDKAQLSQYFDRLKMISFTNISGAEEIGSNSYLLEMDGTRIVLDAGMHPKKRGAGRRATI
jgi:mRNA degradation ribonuclease J1/J2